MKRITSLLSVTLMLLLAGSTYASKMDNNRHAYKILVVGNDSRFSPEMFELKIDGQVVEAVFGKYDINGFLNNSKDANVGGYEVITLGKDGV